MNNFSSDTTCKAWWRCNQAGLLSDTIGSNHLTGYNAPAAETSLYKEGDACLKLDRSLSQYAAIADDSLDDSFPLKLGDQEKIFSLCLWLRPASLGDQVILCKADGNRRTFLIGLQQGELQLHWGYNDGLSVETFRTAFRTSPDQWYHLYVFLHGLQRRLVCRLYHDTLRSWQFCSFLPHNELWVGGGSLFLGASPDGQYYHGLLDEVLIFNAPKNPREQQQIIQGLFGHPTQRPTRQPSSPPSAGWRWNQTYWL